MKYKMPIAIAILLIVGAGAAYFYWPQPAEVRIPAGKVMSIESYITSKISELSPKPAVLGGTFQVTSIALSPSEEIGQGTGTVSYEDGHVAYVADFSYEIDDFTGVKIMNFITRE